MHDKVKPVEIKSEPTISLSKLVHYGLIFLTALVSYLGSIKAIELKLAEKDKQDAIQDKSIEEINLAMKEIKSNVSKISDQQQIDSKEVGIISWDFHKKEKNEKQ